MTRSLAGACALAVAMVGVSLPAHTQAGERTLPMRFELRQQTGVCTDQCRTWISAAGAITSDTPRDFLSFAQNRELRGMTVALDSDGGSVLGAIALGREFRRLDLTTTVGRTIDTQAGADGQRASLSPRADCGSMCAFVLLGGAHRMVPSEARVLVHQIWLGDRRDDPAAANYSAEDLVLVQRDIGRLAQYTIEMGGGIELLDLALRIPPWEPMHALSRDEIRRIKLDNGADDQPATVAQAAPLTKVSTLPGADGLRATPVNDRRWAMVDNASGAMLARRHPLTIEGDEVGVFDLNVSCGTDGGYLVNYSETRRGNAHWALPNALKTVSIRLGSQTVTLKVASSERRSSASELVTSAAGTVPAALIGAFAAAGNHAMMVETTSAETVTAIRVGNTGATQSLPRLAARCEKPANRADLAMKKTGGQAAAQ